MLSTKEGLIALVALCVIVPATALLLLGGAKITEAVHRIFRLRSFLVGAGCGVAAGIALGVLFTGRYSAVSLERHEGDRAVALIYDRLTGKSIIIGRYESGLDTHEFSGF